MRMAPDFGAEVDGREDSGGVYPDVVEDVGAEGSDEVERMGVKVGDAGDVTEEVSIDELLLGDPEFIAAVVDDSVLVGMAIRNKGAGRSGEEVREDVG